MSRIQNDTKNIGINKVSMCFNLIMVNGEPKENFDEIINE